MIHGQLQTTLDDWSGARWITGALADLRAATDGGSVGDRSNIQITSEPNEWMLSSNIASVTFRP